MTFKVPEHGDVSEALNRISAARALAGHVVPDSALLQISFYRQMTDAPRAPLHARMLASNEAGLSGDAVAEPVMGPGSWGSLSVSFSGGSRGRLPDVLYYGSVLLLKEVFEALVSAEVAIC